MKDLHMLVWLTQVGISVAAPPVVFLLIAVWLRNRQNVMLMEKMHQQNHKDPPSVPGFNEHI